MPSIAPAARARHKAVTGLWFAVAGLLCCAPPLPRPAAAQELDGTAIMKKVDTRDDGKDLAADSTFLLENDRAERRVRKLKQYWLDLDGKDKLHSKTILFFIDPPDVANTGLLNWSYEAAGTDDDQWLYLPAYRKTKRIAGSDKEDNFVGTDFTYEDMSRRAVEEDNHKLVRTEALDGKPCYVVESTPKRADYLYSKRLIWVEKDAWIFRKVEFYDRKGQLWKTLVVTWQQVTPKGGGAPVWVWKRALMTDLAKKHKTLVELTNVVMNSALSDDLFSKMRLEQGAR